MSQREQMQHSLALLRTKVAETQTLAAGLRVPVNASSYTQSSLECVQPDMIAERLDVLDQWLANAGDIENNWHVAIALGQLFDERVIYIPDKIIEPMKALQERAATARMLDPIAGELLTSVNHMDKIIECVSAGPKDEPLDVPTVRDRRLPYDYDGDGVAGYLPELRDRGVQHDKEDEDEAEL